MEYMSVFGTMSGGSSKDTVFSAWAHVMFGTLTLLFFLIGVPGGSLSLWFFLRKRPKTINTHIFILINLTDIIICFLMLFVGISHYDQGSALMFSDSVFCNLWAMLWQIVIRVSVFLVGVLSVTRVISILKPTYRISVTVVLTLILMYTVCISVQSTVPLWVNSQYEFKPYLSRCTWNSTEYLKCGPRDTVYSTLHLLIEWSLPVLPVIVSCGVLVYKLQCKVILKQLRLHGDSRTSISSTSSVVKRESTITVVILTSVYLLCSTTSAIFHFGYYVDYLKDCGKESRFAEGLDPVIMTLLTTYAIPLNSALNTIIYYCRIKDLRSFALDKLRLLGEVRKMVCCSRGELKTFAEEGRNIVHMDDL